MALSKYNNYNGALWSFLYYMYQLTTPIIRTYPMFTTVDMLGSSVGTTDLPIMSPGLNHRAAHLVPRAEP
jgi:hypothetical protein